MTKKQLGIVAALMIVSVAIGALLVTDFNRVPLGFAGPNDIKLGADNPPVTPTAAALTLNDAFVAVSKAVTPQVVNITVTTAIKPVSKDESDSNPFGMEDPFGGLFPFPQRPPSPQRGSGSGVIITPDGYILTNNHVVENAADDGIIVEMIDGSRMEAKLIGTDNTTDLAVIKVEGENLPTASFANSDQVEVGELVMAVGNPLGLTSTVTQGIISAIGRGQLNLNRDNEGYGIEDFIQTDAAINPGNSGGGLFDLSGALVGINSAIATRTGYYQGYGFAIPINLARAVAQDLIEDGEVNRGYIGVQIKSVDQNLAKYHKLQPNEGVLIDGVVAGGAGEKAGLKQGDIVLEVDGQKVSSSNHLQSLVARKRAGDQINVKVFRYGDIFDKTITLKPRDNANLIAESKSPREDELASGTTEGNIKLSGLGMEVGPINTRIKRDRNVDHGVLVTEIENFGEAMSQGIRENDIVLSVNRKPVNSPAEFKKGIEDTKRGDVVLMQVKRSNGTTSLVALEVGK